jgi:hypothetical protein
MGVEFKLKDGKHLFIGSGRAEEFARAMEEWLSSKCAPGSASGV